MKTGNPVEDSKKKRKLSYEEVGKITNRVDEIKRIINSGIVPFRWAADEMQRVIEDTRHFNVVSVIDRNDDSGRRVPKEDVETSALTNDQLGLITRREDEIKRRIRRGALPFGRGEYELNRISQGLMHVVTITTCTVIVDETKSIEALKEEAVIKDDYKSKQINSANFPQRTDGKKQPREMALFRFHEAMGEPRHIFPCMIEHGYRQANIWDLLGFAVAQPVAFEKNYIIIAVDTNFILQWFGHVYPSIVSLDFDQAYQDKKRFLDTRDTNDLSDHWQDDTFILGVKKD